jgi:ferredoxin
MLSKCVAKLAVVDRCIANASCTSHWRSFDTSASGQFSDTGEEEEEAEEEEEGR